jgi:hypothetical protein
MTHSIAIEALARRRHGNASSCARCGTPLRPKHASRRQRYCSYRCRDTARRERNFAVRPVQNNALNPMACKGDIADRASALAMPIELLGHGYRWPRPTDNEARTELIARVIAAEIGGGRR